jgi:signal transduction histidine kinase
MSPGKPLRSDCARLAGLSVWLSVGGFLPLCTDPSVAPLGTAGLYLGFGALFLWTSRQPPGPPSWAILAALLCQTLAALALLILHPFFLMTNLLVIVGWQLAVTLPTRIALIWILAQSLFPLLLLGGTIPWPALTSSLGAGIGFQIFALAMAERTREAVAAQRELDGALHQLAEAQADLITRERQEERLRIARDLHDELGHGLTALGIIAACAEQAAPDTPSQAQAAALKRAAGDLVGRVRTAVSTLREDPDEDRAPAEIDLEVALHAFCQGAHGPISVRLTLAGDLSSVPRPVGVTILRLIQEALTNALRHAGERATTLTVAITRLGDTLDIEVVDDGSGAARIAFGNGLFGMRERLAKLGAALAVGGASGEGFRLTTRVPLGGA